MVHGAFEAEIAPAYLAGTEPHETSPFPDIIPYYNEVKVPKKEQEAQDKVVKNIVDKVWKKRQRLMQKASE